MFNTFLLIILGTTITHAEEAPAGQRVVRNGRGIANNPAVSVGWDSSGCPTVNTNAAQYLSADEAAVLVDAGVDARVRCSDATVHAEVLRKEAEGDLLRDKAEAGATLLLAHAGADAVRMAADGGQATYVDADRKVAATGNAAPLAAFSGNDGYAPLGTFAYGQAAWALTRPVTPEAPPAASGNSGSSSGSGSLKMTITPVTVTDAETRARKAAAAAGVTLE